MVEWWYAEISFEEARQSGGDMRYYYLQGSRVRDGSKLD